jgi:2,4-diaminopentanoate dehydrogenase
VTIRVIQWATGPVGSVQLAEVIDNPEFDLVGLFVYSPDKVGVDAGALAGRPDTGIVATNDKAAILALDAEVVLHSASKAYGFDANTDDIVALLETGKSVITVTSYAHLPTLGSAVDERIRKACAVGRSRFCPAGEHPGFMLEKLAVSLTALSQRVDTITVQQFVDCSHVPEERMLVDLMGMGKRPEEISVESPAFRSVSTQSEQAIGAAADALGVHIDHIDHVIQTATSPNDVTLDCTTLPAGTVVGQILSWTGYHDGKPVLVVEEYWTCTPDIPDCDLALDGHTVRIRVDGVPNIDAEVRVDTDPIVHFSNVSGGLVAVGISALRAIPYVLKAPPGVVVPEVFGAYRWPGAAAIG